MQYFGVLSSFPNCPEHGICSICGYPQASSANLRGSCSVLFGKSTLVLIACVIPWVVKVKEHYTVVVDLCGFPALSDVEEHPLNRCSKTGDIYIFLLHVFFLVKSLQACYQILHSHKSVQLQ